jgi:5-methylcytosine-specific restriction endonuclease McrA
MLSNTRHRTIAQGFASDESFEEYSERKYQEDKAIMDAAVDAVYEAAKMLAPHLPLIFPYGDGRGGWLMRTLCEEAGLDLDRAVSDKKKNQQLKPSLRTAVMERDAYRCKHCDDHINLSVDHIYPKSKGGSDDMDNLQTLCRSCNSKKGAKVVSHEQ